MRALPLIAVVAFLAIAACWLQQAAPHEAVFGPGSSLSYEASGLSQARSYLADVLHCEVATLSRPLSRGALPPRAVLLRISPEFQHYVRPLGAAGAQPGRGDGTPSTAPRDPSHPPHDAGVDQRDATSARVAPGPDRVREDGADAKRDEGDERDASGEAGGSLAPFRPLLSEAEDAWVVGGGRLVLGLAVGNEPIAVDEPAGAAPLEKTFPALPGATRLVPPAVRTLGGAGMREAITVFAAGDHPLIARIQRGAGDVWLVACPEILDNGHLGLGDHLQLLADLCTGRPVRFDEFAHGLVDDVGVRELLVAWRLGPALLLAGVAGCLWFWRGRILLGEASPPPPPPRAEAIDGIGALGGLYSRAMTRGQALESYYRRYRRQLRARLGLDEAAAAREVDQRLPSFRASIERAEHDAKGFAAAIARLNAASRRLRDDRTRRRP